MLYKISVSGRVQGVGFRWNAVNEARSLGITGYVKNMADGSVFIVAEGFRDQLKIFMEWCRRGPGLGFVDKIDAEEFPPAGYSDFSIRF